MSHLLVKMCKQTLVFTFTLQHYHRGGHLHLLLGNAPKLQQGRKANSYK